MATAPDALDKAAYRALARERLEHLSALLKSRPQTPSVRSAVDLAGHLVRAVDAFHMEAIRFRMYTLDRLFASGALDLPAEAHDMLADVKHALEAAGFHTKSVAH